MKLPSYIQSDAPTLALLIRAKLTGEVVNTSYDDAWDALEKPQDYAPSEEVETWMRANWHEAVFGAAPQEGEIVLIPQESTISRTLARSWMPKFLEVFEASGGNASQAAREAKVEHSTPYKARDKDPVFSEAWTWAERRIGDRLRAVMWERGVEGWDETVFGSVGNFQDGPIGVLRKYDHSFIKQMAVARCEELKEKKDGTTINVNNSATANAAASATVTKEDIAARQLRTKKKLAHVVDRAKMDTKLLKP